MIYRIMLEYSSLGDRDYTLDIVHPGSHSKPKVVIYRSIVAQDHQGPRRQSTHFLYLQQQEQVFWAFPSGNETERE